MQRHLHEFFNVQVIYSHFIVGYCHLKVSFKLYEHVGHQEYSIIEIDWLPMHSHLFCFIRSQL